MPIEDMWQLAPEASVALIASQTSESGRAASKNVAGSARSGGFSSAVRLGRQDNDGPNSTRLRVRVSSSTPASREDTRLAIAELTGR